MPEVIEKGASIRSKKQQTHAYTYTHTHSKKPSLPSYSAGLERCCSNREKERKNLYQELEAAVALPSNAEVTGKGKFFNNLF